MSATASLRCQACDDPVTREEYVAVGDGTPAARVLELTGQADRERGHLVVCDGCFNRATRQLAGDDAEGDE